MENAKRTEVSLYNLKIITATSAVSAVSAATRRFVPNQVLLLSNMLLSPIPSFL